MAALWSLAAYGASAAYGDDSGVGTSSYFGTGSYYGSYNYGNLQCTAEAAAAECKYCSEYGELTDLGCKEMADDGECDYSCNSAGCAWDGMDCFHDDK